MKILVKVIADGLQIEAFNEENFRQKDTEGIVIVDDKGHFISANSAARNQLRLLMVPYLTPAHLRHDLHPRQLISSLLTESSVLERFADHNEDLLITSNKMNNWGRFVLRFHRLKGTAPEERSCIVLTINHLVPDALFLYQQMDKFSLSRQQKSVCLLLAKGLPQKEIAHILSISLHTLNTHLRRIFLKLNVNSQVELVRILNSRHEPSPPRY